MQVVLGHQGIQQLINTHEEDLLLATCTSQHESERSKTQVNDRTSASRHSCQSEDILDLSWSLVFRKIRVKAVILFLKGIFTGLGMGICDYIFAKGRFFNLFARWVYFAQRLNAQLLWFSSKVPRDVPYFRVKPCPTVSAKSQISQNTLNFHQIN